MLSFGQLITEQESTAVTLGTYLQRCLVRFGIGYLVTDISAVLAVPLGKFQDNTSIWPRPLPS
jgi:hypothetical protein